MLIYAIDDEPNMLYLLHDAISEAMPEAEIRDFRLGSEAVAQIENDSARPDVVFSDIRMPGLTGLELAARMKKLSPETKMVFVTGYDDYAVDAYRLHVRGYIPKPVEAGRVREELEALFPGLSAGKRLKVRCFGSFEVFCDKQPLQFARARSRELFAFLVDRRGAFCTAEEAVTALWEEIDDMAKAKHRLRNLVSDMNAAFAAVGMDDVLIRRRNQCAVNMDRLDCDYYRMLDGDAEAAKAFHGEYMEQYSWAEPTKGRLSFQTALV